MIEKELTVEGIKKLIYVVNNKKVMLDSDIAKIYNMETKYLNRIIKRNFESFKNDTYFQISNDEIKSLRCQFVTLNETENGRGNHRKYLPYVFTIEGIETLNSILKSKGSIELLSLFKSAFEDENNIIIKPKALDLSDTDIKAMIYNVRGLEVMLDSDLAKIYGCEGGPKVINQAVKRNPERFPNDFYFRLTTEEFSKLRSQFVTAIENNMSRNLPYVFTEQGVSMLSAVLKTKNVSIMRAFVEMRKFISDELLEQRNITNMVLKHDNEIKELQNTFKAFKTAYNEIFFEGEIFDAYSLIIDIIKQANKKILIIDNYIDNSILNMLTKKKENVEVIILTSNNTKINNLDIEKFNAEYPKLSIKYTNKFHDRFILLDNEILYHLGASIKDLGKKCFAINRMQDIEYINKIINNI